MEVSPALLSSSFTAAGLDRQLVFPLVTDSVRVFDVACKLKSTTRAVFFLCGCSAVALWLERRTLDFCLSSLNCVNEYLAIDSSRIPVVGLSERKAFTLNGSMPKQKLNWFSRTGLLRAKCKARCTLHDSTAMQRNAIVANGSPLSVRCFKSGLRPSVVDGCFVASWLIVEIEHV